MPEGNRAIFCLADVAVGAGGLASGSKTLPITGVCTDSRSVEPGNVFVALRGDNFDGHDYVGAAATAGAVAAVVRRGFDRRGLPEAFGLVEVDDPLRALGALARVHRRRFPSLKLGAITGSNGKTTTKELTHAALTAALGKTLKTEGNLNNEIGLPLTLLGLDPSHRAAAIEMGMNQAGEIARLTAIAEPAAGLVTCVQPVHMEGLGSVEAIARAKGELFRGLPAGGIAVVNLDDPLVVEEARASGRETIGFGAAEGADVRLLRIVSHDRRGLAFELALEGEAAFVRIPLVGRHNARNACAAVALGLALGGEPDRLLEGLAAARGFSRRLELKEAPGGVTVLDDCYNGNPASAVAALRTARELAGEGRVIAVLGDLRELGDLEVAGHREVGAAAAACAVAGLVAFGPRSHETAAAAIEGGLAEGAVLRTEDPAEALAWLRAALRGGDLVVAKASRGTRLERIVDPLVGGEEA
ncbi:MAG TPA: UDP-N-acetylmuramoyl-tripeptide--D-alanyl-D-alanine ligase [Vulgatibacter sp.]|nr:UDP-N-acetylmuramoyl-tripeptide--D-alanyl-D-alanine ligase [Vulgatibacter sp.]